MVMAIRSPDDAFGIEMYRVRGRRNVIPIATRNLTAKWGSIRRQKTIQAVPRYRVSDILPSAAQFVNVSVPAMIDKRGLRDQLKTVRFSPPSHVFVVFDDGRKKRLDLSALLGMRPADYDFSTMRIDDSRTALEVKATDGEVVLLDSSSLLALADPQYAKELQETFTDLLGPVDCFLMSAEVVKETK